VQIINEVQSNPKKLNNFNFANTDILELENMINLLSNEGNLIKDRKINNFNVDENEL